ncbi:MAG: cell division protein [Actinomycetaceae bacterium]|nr:cell division protein [Actinomycetaceae bacterium]
MMSELHLELATLKTAGVNLLDTGEVYRQAAQRGFNLTTGCIDKDSHGFSELISAWDAQGLFGEEALS